MKLKIIYTNPSAYTDWEIINIPNAINIQSIQIDGKKVYDLKEVKNE